jgi:hypothetical protein
MTFEPWMLSFIVVAVMAAALWFWMAVWRTPLRSLLSLIVRYRLRHLLDILAGVRKSPDERFATESVRAYEEIFDTILVIKALDGYYLTEFDMKFSDRPDDDGRTPPEDLADLYLALTLHSLLAVSAHLFERRFRTGTEPKEILTFLVEERRLIEREPQRILDHPERLWRKFGRGRICGWRTSVVIKN